MSDTYKRLAAHFDRHHKDPRGLEYLTGEQVVSRLNEVLGPGGWHFAVKEHGYDSESDEMWCLGQLMAHIDGQLITREQFGSQKHNRSRQTSKVLDYGFDAKGAATDALKKCATLIGVGLYLSEKDGGIPQESYTPTDVREVADNPDIVRSADDKDWATYQRGRTIALGLNVKFKEMQLPQARADLQNEILRLAGLVRQRNAELDKMAAAKP